MSRKKIAANYKVKEPINNFKLRVRIVQQRPLLAELVGNDGDTRDSNFLQQEDRIFSWQEKVFSPFEATFYSDANNCSTERQKLYCQQIKENDIRGSRLYTYTRYDSYYPENELLTRPYETVLSIRNRAALPAFRNRKPFRDRYDRTVVDEVPGDTRIRTNHYLYTERSRMYVMVDLSRRDKTASSDADTETVLCTVTYDESRQILSLDPDLTDERCYAVTNSDGVKFNYWLVHASEKPSSLELQRQQNDSRREIRNRLMYREAEISHAVQLTPPNVIRFFIKLDIVSAHQFFYDGLSVSYQMNLPQHWSTDRKDTLFGRTQRCNLKDNSAYFSYATEMLLDFQSTDLFETKDVLPSWPRLLLSVVSLDSWSRYRTEGYTSIPLPVLPGSYTFDVPTWRPTGSIVNSLRRFFTGGTYELEDITHCSVPQGHEGKMLNKSQLKVTPSGNIKLNMSIIRQTNSTKDDDQLEYLQRLSTDKFMTNVESIFEQFKTAREHMLRIKNLNI